MQTPFIGSEAVAAGRVRKYELRSRFTPMFPDVYTDKSGDDLTIYHRATAAWLWSRRGGVIARLTASKLHGAKYIDDCLPIELAWSGRRPPPGIVTHKVQLAADDVVVRGGLPFTSAERTAFDIGRRGTLDESIARLDALGNATGFTADAVRHLALGHRGARRHAPREGEVYLGFGPLHAHGSWTLSATGDLVEAAANLFRRLHEIDATGAARIAVAPIPHHGLGEAINDSYFGVIFTLDEGDDWRKEANWRKANPALGSAKSLAYMRSEARSAAEVPSQLNNFLTKELNVWCNQAQAWFDIFVWDKGNKPFTPESLHGRECYGGLDLADTTDLAAFELVFPPVEGDPDWYLLSWIFCPAENIDLRAKRDKVLYPAWVKSGHLIATPGNVTDYERIREEARKGRGITTSIEVGYRDALRERVVSDPSLFSDVMKTLAVSVAIEHIQVIG